MKINRSTYNILIPLGALPLWLLLRVSDFVFLIVYYLIGYRKQIVRNNLKKSFPTKSEKELRSIERKFYRHLSDIFMEGYYNTAASLTRISRHYKFENAEILLPYYEQGKSIVLMSAHYNNWEFMITTLDSQIGHHGIGVGKPLSNPRFGKWITGRRSRFGTEIVDQTDVRAAMSFYNTWNIPVAYMMLSDQSPSNPYRSYWTQFLHQDTAFLFGAEHFARKYDMPVFFYDVDKIQRGQYIVRFQLIAEKPNDLQEGAITQLYARHLESLIEKEPQYWLWSHRRWKLTHNGRINKDGTVQAIHNH